MQWWVQWWAGGGPSGEGGTLQGMTAQKTAAVTAVLGGLLWLVAALSAGSGLAAVCFVAGGLLLVVALFAGGYTTVATAPAWLRVLVPVAVVALGWIVFASVDAAAQGATSNDSRGDALAAGVCGIVAMIGGVAGGLVGWRRTRAAAPRRRPTGGHRASRGACDAPYGRRTPFCIGKACLTNLTRCAPPPSSSRPTRSRRSSRVARSSAACRSSPGSASTGTGPHC